jgi:hypothetical protein
MSLNDISESKSQKVVAETISQIDEIIKDIKSHPTKDIVKEVLNKLTNYINFYFS